MKLFRFMLLLLFFASAQAAFACCGEPWPEGSKKLLEQAQAEPDYPRAQVLNPSYFPTGDGKSFFVFWPSGSNPPQKWIVSLPGTHGWATRDLAIWSQLLRDRDVGLVVLQWWLGAGDTPQDYYSPADIYREIDAALTRLNVAPGTAMLQGFSRGSSNLYAVAALDHSKKKYFSLLVANSGGAAENYSPTKAISDGAYGPEPLENTHWVTVCGMKDPHPERDGCPGMQRTANWLQAMGGTLDFAIEDPVAGHGALATHPVNAARVLDYFLKSQKP